MKTYSHVQIKRNESQCVYWIRFYDTCCKVISSEEFRMVVNKYIAGSYVKVSGSPFKTCRSEASLHVLHTPARSRITRWSVQHNNLLYVLHITGSLHFYYPMVAQLLQRIFMSLWYKNEGIILHGSAVLLDEKAYIFVGKSGKGKTTISRLAHEYYGLRILSDNQVFIQKRNNRFRMYPFPFSQYHKFNESTEVEIAGLYLLHKATSYRVKKIGIIDALRLFPDEIQIISSSDFIDPVMPSAILKHVLFSVVTQISINRLYFPLQKGLVQALRSSVKHEA